MPRPYSRLNLVEVTVTDAKGQAIHGLKQSDFTLKEDGKPQPVRSFREVREGVPAASQKNRELPPNVYTNVQPAPLTSAVNVLLLDVLNTSAADQVSMREESIRYLKSMPKGTRVAVMGLSSSLRILQGFTSDAAALTAAMNNNSRALPSPFIDDVSEGAIGAPTESQGQMENDDTAAMLTQFENDITTAQPDVRNRMTLEALNQIAAYLADVKGRKNLIWFTEGIPLNLFTTVGVEDLATMTDYAKDLRKTADLLTAADVAVYPIDARKLFSKPANGVDHEVGNITGRTAGVAAESQRNFQNGGQEFVSMEADAEATGGVAYSSTKDLKSAVAKAIADGSNYYALAYVPPHPEYNGKYHSISLEVSRPNVHLSYRKGYNSDDIVHNAITPALTLATSAPEPYGNNMKASMARGVPPSTQLLFDVRVTPSPEQPKPDAAVHGNLDAKFKGRPLVRYDLQYLLPGRQIAFSSGPGGTQRCALEFDIAAYDVYGKLVSSVSQTVTPQPMPPKQLQQFATRPLQFAQDIDLPPGELFLRVGILDETSDRAGTLEVPLLVKADETSGFSGGQSGY